METHALFPAIPARRLTRRHFLAAMAAGLGSALPSIAAGCAPEPAARTTAPPAPASRLDEERPTPTPEPTPTPAPSTPDAAVGGLSIPRLILKGIEWDSAGHVVKAFGFDPATAREVLYPVTKMRALPTAYAPRDLISSSTYGVTGQQPVRAILGADLAEMQKASGDALSMISGYRSFDYQAGLFERYVAEQVAAGLERSAAIAYVNQSSALPGHSEHQLGLAIDLNSLDDAFADTRLGRWLHAEAWRYGFVLSYTAKGQARSGYQYEPWHYRWVGRPLARLLAEQGYLDSGEHTPTDYYEAIWSLLPEAK